MLTITQQELINCFLCNRAFGISEGLKHANYHRQLNQKKRLNIIRIQSTETFGPPKKQCISNLQQTILSQKSSHLLKNTSKPQPSSVQNHKSLYQTHASLQKKSGKKSYHQNQKLELQSIESQSRYISQSGLRLYESIFENKQLSHFSISPKNRSAEKSPKKRVVHSNMQARIGNPR